MTGRGRLDELVKYRGPCAFCGGPDARHRLFDNIRENAAAGDSPTFLADIYEVPQEAVDLILAIPDMPITMRQYSALVAYVECGNQRDAAERLNINPGSLNDLLERTRAKLGVETNEQAVYIGTSAGWLYVHEIRAA